MAKKHEQLVCQYLENISSLAFERYQKVLTGFMRNRHGIYALYKNNKLYYVGLANNLRGRLRAHLRDRHSQKWDHFSVYLILSNKHLKELESLILRIVQPKANRQKGKFFKSENLRRRFLKDIKNQNELEIEEIVGQGKGSIPKKTKQAETKSRHPSLSKYFKTSTKLRSLYKGKWHKAIIKKDGTIRYKGKIYNSPSMAAITITKRSANGWSFWQFERSPGEWVLLDALRR